MKIEPISLDYIEIYKQLRDGKKSNYSLDQLKEAGC